MKEFGIPFRVALERRKIDERSETMKTQRNLYYHPAIMLAMLLPACPHTDLMAVEFSEPIILESPDAQFEGYFGAGIAWVPDVNNDGIADIVISASFENTGVRFSDSPGRVYAFDGAAFEVLHQLWSPNEKPDSHFGGQVAGIGDLNGNGSGADGGFRSGGGRRGDAILSRVAVKAQSTMKKYFPMQKNPPGLENLIGVERES